MPIKVRTLRNTKVIAKKLIKELKIILSNKPNTRIGIFWDESLAPIFEIVLKSKKIKWSNVKLFSLVEYKDNPSASFDNNLFLEFVNKLNLQRSNYESLKERIDEYIENDNLKELYKFKDGIDLMIFPIDKKGNFLFNNFESKITYINTYNNGNEIICPGIKSIMMAKQIIAFAIDEGMDDIVSILNSKIVSNEDFISLLNIHNNFTLFTLYSIFSKRRINKKGLLIDIDNVSEKVLDNQYEGDLKDDDPIVEKDDVSEIVELSLTDDSENKELIDEEKEINSLSEIMDKINNDSNEFDEKENLFNSFKEEYKEQLKELQKEQNKLIGKNIDDLDEHNIDVPDNDEPIKEKLDEFKKESIDAPKINELENIGNETPIDDREIQSALFEFSENDDKVIEKIKQMDKLKSQELYIPECEGEIEKDIKTLETIKNILEKEIDGLEEKDKISSIDSEINSSSRDNLSDNYDLDDPVLLEANKYTSKSNVHIINDTDLKNPNFKLDDGIPVIGKNTKIISENDSPIPTDSYLNSLKIDTSTIQGRTKDEIEKIIKIKEDTLRLIELLIENNKLASQEATFKINSFQQSFEQKNIDNNIDSNQSELDSMLTPNLSQLNENLIKIKYVPGERPVPLIAIYDGVNEQTYNMCVDEMKKNYGELINDKKFSNDNKHLSNPMSYLSYNEETNEIYLLAFSSFSHFVYLLRYINKPVYFSLSKENFKLIEHEFNGIESEFIITN